MKFVPIILMSTGLVFAAGCKKASSNKGAGGPCKDNSAERCLDMTVTFYKQDPDAANVMLKHLCAGDFGKQTTEACTLSGHVFRRGAPQTKKDPSKALTAYKRGCPLDSKLANSGSCFRLGLAYGKGVLTLGGKSVHAIDKVKGRQYLEKACQVNRRWKLPCRMAKLL